MSSLDIRSLYSCILLFCLSVIVRALLSFLETSVTALRLFRLKEIAQSTHKYKPLLKALEKDPHKVLVTILVANNLTEVTAAMLGTHVTSVIAQEFNFSAGLSMLFGVLFTTLVILIFGEIIPKHFAKARGEKLFGSTLWATNAVFFILSPFVTILVGFIDRFILRSYAGKDSDSSHDIISEKEIQFLIDYINEKGLMELQKTTMLKSIFQLGNTPARDIMIPANRIVSLSVHAHNQEALRVFSKCHFSRLPIYEDTPDNIIGMIHQKDLFLLLAKNEERPLRDSMRPIIFVPESMKVNQLLKELREQRMHMAMVLNEHGTITGMITLEDVLEEIVGDIKDEHEAIDEKIISLKNGSWLVDARIELEELGALLTLQFETEDALTLSGFLSEQLQHLPRKGERIFYKNFYFQVQQATLKQVKQVLIFAAKPSANYSPFKSEL